MDIKNYIASGILEQYVLGLLSEKENSEVVHMIDLHPEVAQHVLTLEEGLEAYAQTQAVQPSAGFKNTMLTNIRLEKEKADSSTKETKKVIQDSAIAKNDQDQPATVTGPGRNDIHSLIFWRRIAYAAAVLLLFSLYLNLYYGNRGQKQLEANQQLQQEKQLLNADKQALAEKLARSENNIQLLSNPAIKQVAMKGVNKHDGLKALVYWNKADGNVYLASNDLPAVPQGKVYQLWAIVDGKPVDLGLYTPQKAATTQKMKPVSGKGQLQAFAITLENAGGSTAPTMDQMFVMGAPA